ncbi:MAG: hypothetical protein II777_10605 [Clostridia bacterium]|nr:hypothetical protein [Clostridia bacterium]
MKIIAYLLIAFMILIPASAPARQAEPHFEGITVYLVQTDESTADICVRAGYDCGLQAFDIYLNTTEYTVESRYDLIIGAGHFMALGFEVEMKQGEEHVIATIHFTENTRAEITRADFAIAHTPEAPAVKIRGSIWLDF